MEGKTCSNKSQHGSWSGIIEGVKKFLLAKGKSQLLHLLICGKDSWLRLSAAYIYMWMSYSNLRSPWKVSLGTGAAAGNTWQGFCPLSSPLVPFLEGQEGSACPDAINGGLSGGGQELRFNPNLYWPLTSTSANLHQALVVGNDEGPSCSFTWIHNQPVEGKNPPPPILASLFMSMKDVLIYQRGAATRLS